MENNYEYTNLVISNHRGPRK